MGWTKADKQKFLDACTEGSDIMPREVIKRQASLFDGIIESDDKSNNYQKIRLVLLYPPLPDNPTREPIAKQSARFFAKRHFRDDQYGHKKGDLAIYPNHRTGKMDVRIGSYQDSKITNTTKMLREQIIKQLQEQHYKKFPGAIFVTRMEFIFTHLKNAPQYMITDLKAGNKIYFKETKPDLDNLEKIVWDSMQIEKINKESMDNIEQDMDDALRGLVYDNDAQIVAKNCVFKRYGMRPGCIVEMEGYA